MVDTLYKLLSIYLPANREQFSLILESSPFFPSALSIVQTFRHYGQDAQIVRASVSDLHSLQKYFIAFVTINGIDDVLLLRKQSGDRLSIYHPATDSFRPLDPEQLQTVWKGVALYINGSPQSKTKRQRAHIRHWFLSILVFLTVTSLVYAGELLLGLSMLALWIGILLGTELTGRREAAFCRAGKYIDCQAVSGSRFAKVFNVPLSALVVAFFGAILCLRLFLYICHINSEPFDQAVSNITIVIFPFIATYSILSQIKIRKACLYCFALLIIMLIISLSNPGLPKVQEIHLYLLVSVGFGLSLCLILVFLRLRTSKKAVWHFRLMGYSTMRKAHSIKDIVSLPLADFLKTPLQPNLCDSGSDDDALIILCISTSCGVCLRRINELCQIIDQTGGRISIQLIFVRCNPKDAYYNTKKKKIRKTTK